ncbi:MAG: peptidoglycan DD-metalloendopeptidase family protein [Rhodobacteraceae bacterium]|nr:peptidoglycan DD-metalloendopeptidase family protein [Paracoccaceae bacterium]
MIRAILLACLVACPAAADPVTEAQVAAEELRQAGLDFSEAERAPDRVAALTGTVRAYERGLAILRDALREAALRERALREKFDTEAETLAQFLGTLETMSRSPEATVLLHPAGALGTARASMLMAEAAPAMAAEADRIRAELEELEVLVLLRETSIETLEDGLAAAQAARTALGDAAADRAGTPNPTEEAIVLALLNGADTLDAFASSLTSAEAGEVGADAFSAARGRLPLPVNGVLLAGYGAADAAGVARPGLLLAAAPRALVSAPFPGTVRYAGPLLDYGNVIILEPEAGYLLVLAGLGDLYAATGTVVRQDDPLGLMSGQDEAAQGNLIAGPDAGSRPRPETLYIELRANGATEDPAPWFAIGIQ